MGIQLEHRPLLPVVENIRAGALTRLREWKSIAPRYAMQEDLVVSDLAGASCLSRYLSHRQLLEEEVLNTLLAQYPPTVICRFFGELCRRTYWKGWMEQHPSVWRDLQERLVSVNREMDAHQLEGFHRALGGATELECFNQWNDELVRTGYLHHRLRMWYASIWIFTLRLPWELGAAHFLRHMLDGDVASNTLSWRSVAGLHPPFEPYLADAKEIHARSGGRFDPRGRLGSKVEMVFGQSAPPSAELLEVAATDQTLCPCLSESPAGLLLTSEDLVPEVGIMSEAPFHSIAAFAAHDVFDAVDLCEGVVEYKVAAMRDAAERASTHWDGALWTLSRQEDEGPARGRSSANRDRAVRMRVYSEEVDEWVRAVVRWARTERLRVVRMHVPAVGPWRDRRAKLEGCLARCGVRLKIYRRRWDALHWPHARGGFASFNEGLEARLAEFFTG